MPTYEYRCPEGHEFELFQRMSDEPRAECPSCGADAERMLSAGAGFLFKGEGFYITDSRSESYREAARKESKTTSGEGASEGSAGSKSGSGGESGAEGAKSKSGGESGAGGAKSSGGAGGASKPSSD